MWGEDVEYEEGYKECEEEYKKCEYKESLHSSYISSHFS